MRLVVVLALLGATGCGVSSRKVHIEPRSVAATGFRHLADGSIVDDVNGRTMIDAAGVVRVPVSLHPSGYYGASVVEVHYCAERHWRWRGDDRDCTRWVRLVTPRSNLVELRTALRRRGKVLHYP